jgi:hypothetical protein
MGKLDVEVEIVEWMDDVRRTVPKLDRYGSRLGLDPENKPGGLTEDGKISIKSVPLSETDKYTSVLNPRDKNPRLEKEEGSERRWVDRKKRVHEKRNSRKVKKSDPASPDQQNLNSSGSIEINPDSLEIAVGGDSGNRVNDSRISSMDDSRMGINDSSENRTETQRKPQRVDHLSFEIDQN